MTYKPDDESHKLGIITNQQVIKRLQLRKNIKVEV